MWKTPWILPDRTVKIGYKSYGNIIRIRSGTFAAILRDPYTTRNVFAPATWVEGIEQGKLLGLLQDSRQSKLGAWEADAEVLYFVIKLPDTVDAAQLDVAIQAAAQMADDMEIRLAGGGDGF